MLMAPSLASPNLPCLHAQDPYGSHCRVSMPSNLWEISTFSRKHRLSIIQAKHNEMEPTKKGDTNMEMNSNGTPNHPAVPTPSVPNVSNWGKWLLGSLVWLAVPSWKNLQNLQDVVKNMDNIVETVEDVAETAEKMTTEVAEDLPGDGGLKKAVVRFGNASEEVRRLANLLDGFIHKIEGLKGNHMKAEDETVPVEEKVVEKKPE